MANKRINDLPAETDPASSDVFAIDGATTRHATRANVLKENLEAIRALTSEADKGIQFTGAGTAAVYDLTAAGKALLDDVDAAAQRATLGVVIGTDVQAYDADLDAFASKTAPSGDVVGTTDVQTLTNKTITGMAGSLASSVTGTTQSASDNSTKIATTAYVDSAVTGGVSGVASLNGQTGALTIFSPPQGRLTLSSGVPATSADLTSQTTIYYTPSGGALVPIHDGTRLVPNVFAELSLALDSTSGHTGYHQSGKNFDLFAINDSGTIRLGTGPAWSSDTARGTGAGTTEIESFNGVMVNKNTITIRFGSSSGNTVSVAARGATLVGSFRATADGQATDSATKRLLSNAYNVLPRPMLVVEATDSWAYSTATFRQANNSTANQAAYLHCLDGIAVSAHVIGAATNSTATLRAVQVGIGISSSTVDSSTRHQYVFSANTAGLLYSPWSSYKGFPGIGYKEIRWLEKGAGSDTQTWYGDAGAPTQLQFGMDAETLN